MKDLFDREFSDKKGVLNKEYLLKSGPPVPFQAPRPPGEDEAKRFDAEQQRLKEQSRFLEHLVENTEKIAVLLKPLIERDASHVDRVIDRRKEMDKPRPNVSSDQPSLKDWGRGFSDKSADYAGLLGGMKSSIIGTQVDIGRFTKAALHKGSLYTHDIHIFQQQARTNQILLEMLKLTADIHGRDVTKVSVTDSLIDPNTNEIHAVNVTLKDLKRAMDQAPTLFNAAMNLEKTMEAATEAAAASVAASSSAPFAAEAARVEDATEQAQTGNHRERMRDLALANGQFAGTMDQVMWKFQHFRGRAMADAVKKLSGGLVGISAFTPMAIDIAESVKYQQVIRQVAYQTEGITEQMAIQQKQFMSRNDLVKISVGTGQKLSDVEKQYVKNLMSGYKVQKDTLKVTRAGLATATLIGSNSEETSSYFNEMYMSLALSAEQMGEIGRGIQQVAHFSKMTGDSLLKAVQASKPFLDNMKATGNLTAASSKGVIAMTAEFQKLGIQEQISPIMNAMTSMEKWLSSDDKAKVGAGILTGGNMDLITGGRIFKDKKAQSQAADRGDNFLRQFGFDSKTFAMASSAQKERANIASMATMGVSVAGFVQQLDVFRKMSKSLAENMSDIDAQIAKIPKADVAGRNALINQKESMRQDARLGIFTNMTELMSKQPGKSANEAFAGARMEDLAPLADMFKELIEADKARFSKAGLTSASVMSPEGMQKALAITTSDAIMKMNKQLLSNDLASDDQFVIKNVESSIQEALADKTGGKMTTLLDQLNAGQQAAIKRESKNVDPILSALDSLNVLNTTIANYVGESVTLLTGILGEVGILALTMGAMSADALVAFGGLFKGKARGMARRGASAAGGLPTFGMPSLAWGEGQLSQGLSSFPRRMRRRAQRLLGRTGRGVGAFTNEMGALAGGLMPGGPAPGRFGAGLARGTVGGINSFFQNFLGSGSMLFSFFDKKLPGFVKSAFDPKMMKNRIAAGFDFTVGNAGPMKALKESIVKSFTIDDLGNKGLGASFVTGAGEYFRNDKTLGGKLVNSAKNTGGSIKSRATDLGTLLAGSSLGKSLAGKAAGIKGALSGAAGSAGRFATGNMNAGEAIFRLARAQEKIPVWGKFAAMFGASSQISEIAGLSSGFIPGMAPGLTAGAAGSAGAAAGAGSIGSVAASALLPVAIFTTAMFSMKQGLESAANYTKLLGVEEENLTAIQIASYKQTAEAAGFLTGILNTLTFGVLSDWIGATGTLTSSLALFLDEWPVLTAAIQAVMIPVKIVYGVLLGLWEFTKEVFKGIWEGAKAALMPLNEAFVYLQDTMSDVWNTLSFAFQPVADALKPFLGEMTNSASIIGTITAAFKILGTAVGGVFKALGMTVGFILKMVLPVFKLAVNVIAGVVKSVIETVAPMIKSLSGIFSGVVDFVSGIVYFLKGVFTGDMDLIGSGIKKIWSGISKVVYNGIKFILSSFINLFLLVPKIVMKGLLSIWDGFTWLLGKLVDWVKNLGTMLFKGLVFALGKVLDGVLSLPRLLGDAVLGLPNLIWNGIQSGFSSMGDFIYSSIVQAMDAIDNWMRDWIPGYDWAMGDKAVGVNPADAGWGGMGGGDWGPAAAVPLPKVPALADGGIVTKGGLAVIGEAGPEAVIPLDLLKSANVMAVKASGAGMAPAGIIHGGDWGKSLDQDQMAKAVEMGTKKTVTAIGTMANEDSRGLNSSPPSRASAIIAKGNPDAMMMYKGEGSEITEAQLAIETAKAMAAYDKAFTDYATPRNPKEQSYMVGHNVTNLSPRQLMKESGGQEVMDDVPLKPNNYSPGWGEKMVNGSRVVTYDPKTFGYPEVQSPPLSPTFEKEAIAMPKPGVSTSKMITHQQRLDDIRSRINYQAIPLVRPDAVDAMNGAASKMSTGKIGESLLPTTDIKTMGVSPSASHSELFDENGKLRSAEASRATMEPMPLQDIHDRIQKEVATSQPDKSQVSSRELTSMASDTERMVGYLADVSKGINKLTDYFKPSNHSGDANSTAASTRSKIRPHNSPQYYNFSFGGFADSAVKGVVNDGVS